MVTEKLKLRRMCTRWGTEKCNTRTDATTS